MKAQIFDIKKYAIHDGPGIRQTIFFKGCPLTCWWCHNPESQSVNIEIFTVNEIFDNKTISTEKVLGKSVLIDELFKEITKEIIFFNESGGGVTFSGGEPLMQAKFLLEILKICQKNNINTCIDTSGFANQKIFESILPFTNLFLYDLKLINNTKHKKYTGVSNQIILSNLKYLNQKKANVIIRIPIIPTINDLPEDINDFINFINNLENINDVELLAYHSIASNKYKRYGKQNKMLNIKEPTKENMKNIQKLFIKFGINCKIAEF